MDKSENFTGASLSPQITRDYRVIRLLGKGGMGDVYLAEQLRVGRRPVALKVLNRSCCENPDLKRRFENEAASAGRIQHPNVVMVYECRATDDGQLYVAMQYVEGIDLGQAIEERGTLPLSEIVEITRQAAAGLGAAHKLGIVHRDIKPANIMLTRDDDDKLVVKVLDFGIARLSEPDSTGAQTKTGVVMGTPHYMSPEQALGKTGDKIDRRSDIYSLAMAVYQMLTGKVAFESDSWMQVIYKHINEAPLPPSQARPDLTNIGPIDQVILKGLEKDREKRYQSAAEFASELEAAYIRMKSGSPGEAHTAIYPGSGSTKQVGLAPPTEAQPIAPSTSTEPIADATLLAKPGQTTPAASGGEAAKTAVIVLEGLEAGSTVAFGHGQRAMAGMDGRASVPLVPGTHEIEVTDPSGARQRGTVTITPQEVGSFKSVPMSQPSRPTVAVRAAGKADSVHAAAAAPPPRARSSAGKKIAAWVSVVILLGLAAAAYIVTRGPGTASQQIDPGKVAGSAGPGQARGEATGRSKAESKDEAKREEEAKRETAASKPAEAEPAKPARNPHETTPAVAPPKVTTEEAGAGEGACLDVAVKRSDGNPVEGCVLTLTHEATGKSEAAKTGPKGLHQFCGLISGHRVTIKAVGPKGTMLGARQLVLKGGNNPVEFQGK